MKLGHDHLGGGYAFLMVDIDRNPAPIIGDADRTISIQHNLNNVTMTCQRFVNRIIDNFINHMMQSRPVIGITDIHAWPFTHRIQSA